MHLILYKIQGYRFVGGRGGFRIWDIGPKKIWDVGYWQSKWDMGYWP